MKKPWLLTAVRILFSLALFFLLAAPTSHRIAPFFPIIDVRQLPSLLKTAQPAYLLAAFVLLFLAIMAVIYRWKIILGANRVSFGRLAHLTFIGFFFNNFLPTAAGGDVFKGYYLLRGHREKKVDMGFSIVFDRIIGTLTIMGLGCLAVLFSFSRLPAGLAYTIIILFLGTLLLLRLASRYSAHTRVTRLLPCKIRPRVEQALQEAHQSFCRYLRDTRLVIRAVGISCLSQALVIIAHYLITRSLGTPVPLALLFLVVPLVWAVSALPSLGGLGVRETGYVFFLQGSLAREEAFALAMVMLGFVFLQSVIGGVLYFAGVRRTSSGKP